MYNGYFSRNLLFDDKKHKISLTLNFLMFVKAKKREKNLVRI